MSCWESQQQKIYRQAEIYQPNKLLRFNYPRHLNLQLFLSAPLHWIRSFTLTHLGDKGAVETLVRNLFASASGSWSRSLHYILYPHCRWLTCEKTWVNWVLVDCDLSIVHGLGSRSSWIRFPTLLHTSCCKTQVGDPSLFHVLSFPL